MNPQSCRYDCKWDSFELFWNVIWASSSHRGNIGPRSCHEMFLLVDVLHWETTLDMCVKFFLCTKKYITLEYKNICKSDSILFFPGSSTIFGLYSYNRVTPGEFLANIWPPEFPDLDFPSASWWGRLCPSTWNFGTVQVHFCPPKQWSPTNGPRPKYWPVGHLVPGRTERKKYCPLFLST